MKLMKIILLGKMILEINIKEHQIIRMLIGLMLKMVFFYNFSIII